MSETALTAQTPEEPRKVKRGDRQTRFLAQSVILEEAGSSGLIRAAMLAISAVVCAFLVWAGFTNVDEVAVTSGEIVPTGQIQTIQHLEGGSFRKSSFPMVKSSRRNRSSSDWTRRDRRPNSAR